VFGGLFFWVLNPFTLEGHNFLNSNPFLTIFSAPDATIGGVQVLFGHRNNTALPLDPACPEHLSDHSWAVLPYYDFHQGFFFPKFLNSFHCWVSQALNGNCPRWAVAFLQKCYWVATKEVPKHITNLISLISKTFLKSPRITNFSCFFFIFWRKKSPRYENSPPTFMGSLQDSSTQTGLFICVSLTLFFQINQL